MNTNLLFIVIVCSLLLGHISLSPLLMTMVLPTSIMASRDIERNDDEGDNNDKADPDGLNLLQICCTWSDKISDEVLEYSMSDEVDDEEQEEGVGEPNTFIQVDNCIANASNFVFCDSVNSSSWKNIVCNSEPQATCVIFGVGELPNVKCSRPLPNGGLQVIGCAIPRPI